MSEGIRRYFDPLNAGGKSWLGKQTTKEVSKAKMEESKLSESVSVPLHEDPSDSLWSSLMRTCSTRDLERETALLVEDLDICHQD